MSLPKLSRIFLLSSLFVALMSLPTSLLAHGHGGGGGSHGGGGFHGGGGGFHGGGSGGFHGSSGFHGGNGGGWHGGGSNGWHGGGSGWQGGSNGWHGGGWNGWHGGGWNGWHGGNGWGWGGCCGWNFGINLNFGPFWGGGYPYYVYSPGYVYYPYPYPYYPYPYYPPYPPNYGYAPVAPTDYQGRGGYVQGDLQSANPGSIARPQSYVAQPPPRTNSPVLRQAAYAPHASTTADAAVKTYNAAPAPRHLTMRPEVENVVRALRGMPPAARQRAVASGRYSNLSANEMEYVKYSANPASPAVN